MDFGSPVYRSVNVINNMNIGTIEEQRGAVAGCGDGWTTRPSSTGRMENNTTFSSSKQTPHNERRGSCWVWKIETGVSPPPMFYPVNKWNTLTVDDLSLGTITSRISEFLRISSIAAQYKNKEQDASVHCRTQNSTDFVINIWQNQTTPGFLVHVQHVSGCSFEMNQLKENLWDAILNGNNNSNYTNSSYNKTSVFVSLDSRGTSANFRACEMMMDMMLPSDQEIFLDVEEEKGSPLEFCKRLLESRQWSERRLGLESLVVLTDGTKTIPGAVQQATSAVLFDSCFQNLLTEYISDVAAVNGDNKNNNSGNNQGENQERYSYYYESGMHGLVLRILVQSFQHYKANNFSQNYDISFHNPFWGKLVLETLLYNIQNAAGRPMEACLSVQCLICLNDISQMFLMLDAGVLSGLGMSLESAHVFGTKHNLSLQMETERLLCRMSATVR